MKTKVLIALCFVAAQTFAQKMNSKDVPANVKAGLEKNHLAKEAKWEKEGDNYEANFKKGGKEMSAVFDGTGTLIETEVEIARHELPRAAQDILAQEYAGFKVEETTKITTRGVVSYEAEVEKGEQSFELIFDTTGKLLKKEAQKEGDEM
jgi:hypothetical protein